MKDYKITFNGQEVTAPREWQDTSILLSWSDDILKKTVDLSYTFIDDAYQYLKDAYNQGFCSTVDVVIYLYGSAEIKGKIFLSEITIDRIKCTISAPISGNIYDALIENKTSQKYFLTIGRASNGTSITPASTISVEFHDVETGNPLPVDRECYDAFDTMEFLLQAMSNGQVGFQSEFFTTGLGFGDVFTTGAEIRNPGATQFSQAEASWDQVYGSLKTIWNLAIDLIEVSGLPTIKVEPYEYFRQFGESEIFRGLNNLTETIDTGSLYSVVKIGGTQSRQYDQDDPNTSFINEEYIGWDDEQYNIAGECVVSNELAIQVTLIVYDNNSIQNQLDKFNYTGSVSSLTAGQLVDFTAQFGFTDNSRVINTTTGAEAISRGTLTPTQITLSENIFTMIGQGYSVEYQNASQDKDIFLIRTQEGYGVRETVQFSTSDGFLYNKDYANDSVLSNWANRIHNSAFRFSTGDGEEFEAATTAVQQVSTGCDIGGLAYWADPGDLCGYGPAIPFDNVIFDPGSNFDITDYVFEVPSIGTFLFEVNIIVDVTITSFVQFPKGGDFVHTIVTRFYEDTSAVEVGRRFFTFDDFRPQPFGNPETATKRFEYSQFFVYTGLIGDKVRPYIEFFNNLPLGFQFGTLADFQVGCTFKSRGRLISPNNALRFFTSELPVKHSEYRAIESNRYQQIGLLTELGHLKSINYRPFGSSTVEIEQLA